MLQPNRAQPPTHTTCLRTNQASSTDSVRNADLPATRKKLTHFILDQFQFTPPLEPGQDRPIRAAVAIDCEMGTAISGDSELIRISAIDYYTGEVLINNLVEADQKLAHLNTKYSGVTWSEMNKALRQGTCLAGKAGARAALWRFVGPQTIIMGHAVSNDLRALRICHPCIVDSFLVEYKIVQAKKDIEKAETIVAAKEAEELKARMIELYGDSLEKDPEVIKAPVASRKKTPKGTGDCALKTLMKKYLDTDVQMQGNKGHDSMEDAIAARDLIYWMVCNPEREV
jgi:RNA exonuclease 1